MAQDKFDVTFIRGPRDVSPWRKAARAMSLRTRLHVAEEAMQSRTDYAQKRDDIEVEKYPNATYFLKGRNSQ